MRGEFLRCPPAGRLQIYLSKLNLSGFRNHRDTRLELKPGLAVFQGENGHGKSNLLEAAYLLAIAKSPRASNDRELVNWEVGEQGGHVQVLGVGQDRGQTVQAQLDIDVLDQSAAQGPSIRKSLRINGIVRNASEFVGHLNIVFFEADDLEIISGSPSVRRRFLDILNAQSDPQFLKTLQRYQRVVTQRNQLLKMIRENRSGRDELEFWNERLSYEGATIVENRRRSVQSLTEEAVPAHERLTDGHRLELEYQPRMHPDGDPVDVSKLPHHEIAAKLQEGMAAARDREIGQGQSVIGPHRDDLSIVLDGNPAGTFASRGQGRIIALALKMAEAAVVKGATGRTPMLALDDILSELDHGRRALVMEGVEAYEQVLLTVTDTSLIEDRFLENAALYTVRDGKVERA